MPPAAAPPAAALPVAVPPVAVPPVAAPPVAVPPVAVPPVAVPPVAVPPAAAPPAPVPAPSGPCVDVRLRCPDLVVLRPKELEVVRSRSGRLRLRSRNRLANQGSGPLFLLGDRDGGNERSMAVRQRIYAISGAHREHPLPETHFDFWTIPNQGRFWKLRDALHFELWTTGQSLDELIKAGRKTRFCMRDLARVEDGALGPRVRQFPACSQSGRAEQVRMGISVGWLESYPAGYYEQYVDVTGLRGCYSLRHIADPLAHVFEADESNNVAQRHVLLPPRRGRVRGC
ncbi:MAG TPA: lysyl oxidase family protein [Solirubrobacteraceae bacterium]|nr:lysyl oxidase family protein [Solirubrobacteraceae bacterium]